MLQRLMIFMLLILSSALYAMEKDEINVDELKQQEITLIGTTNVINEIPPQIKSGTILNDIQEIESTQKYKKYIHNILHYLENPASFGHLRPSRGIVLLDETAPTLDHYSNENAQ